MIKHLADQRLFSGGGRAQVGLSVRIRTGVLNPVRLASVRAFATNELADPRPIDLLVNSAGLMALPERRVSPDDHELKFAINALGRFVWTGLLLSRVLKAPAPRVVNVLSYAHT